MKYTIKKEYPRSNEFEPKETSGCAIALGILLTIIMIVAAYRVYIG